MSNNDVAYRLDVNINTVKVCCLRKKKDGGSQRALFDDQISVRTDVAKSLMMLLPKSFDIIC